MKTSYFALVAAAGLAFAAPAQADDDGSWSLDGCGFLCVQQNIDVGNGAIGNNELANGAVSETKLDVPLANKINGKADTATVNGQIGGLQGQIDGHSGQIGALQSGKADKSYVDAQNNAQNSAIILNYVWDYGQQNQINANTAKNVQQDARLGDVETKNEDQDETLAEHETRIGDTESKNVQQDNRLDKHKQAIKANYAWDAQQQKQINHQGNAIAYNYAWDYGQQKQIWGLQGSVADHENRLNAHQALLSQHSARLDEHAKGLAIAMAMPDSWLSDKEKFAVAGNLGGFGDETAIAFSGIARINQTWSLNGGLGADTEFKEFGWKVGARAGW